MILSRICFNPLHPAVYRLAGDPYGLHIRLCKCFGASRSSAGILHRWEEGPTLLVQSEFEPDWSKLYAFAGLKLHLYGKHHARPGRKMGHFTVLASDLEQAHATALAARAAIGISDAH